MSILNDVGVSTQLSKYLARAFEDLEMETNRHKITTQENSELRNRILGLEQVRDDERTAEASERATASSHVQDEERYLLKFEELEARRVNEMKAHQKELDDLNAKLASNDRVQKELNACIEEKNTLTLEIQRIKDKAAHAQSALAEKVKLIATLQKECENHTSSMVEQDKKLRSAQDFTASLQAQLSETSEALEQCRDLVVQTEAREAELHMQANLAAMKLAVEQQSASTDREHASEHLRSVNSEVQALKAMNHKQEQELGRLRTEFAVERAKSAAQAAPVKTYSSIAVATSRIQAPEFGGAAAPKQKRQLSKNASTNSQYVTSKRAAKRPLSDVYSDEQQGKASQLARNASPMPQPRREALNSQPELDVLIPADLSNASFNRTTLAGIIGGAAQSLIVQVVSSAKPLAKKYVIEKFLCPKMDHNPWLPTGPGKHGYMLVGLGRERTTFLEPENLHIFVGFGSLLQYCGLYRVHRVEPLSVAEWESLPRNVRSTYASTTGSKEKGQKHGTDAEILAKYDSGALQAPCVMLQCIEFNQEFFRELVDAANAITLQAPSQRPAKKAKVGTARKNGDRESEERATDTDGNDDADDATFGEGRHRLDGEASSSASNLRRSARASLSIKILPQIRRQALQAEAGSSASATGSA